MKKILFGVIILLTLSGCFLAPPEVLPTEYDVNFIVDDEIIFTSKVLEGESALAPSNPEKEGYTFIGWDKEYINIVSNMDIYAVFEEIVIIYEVKFYVEGIVINTQEVANGENALAPNDPIKEGYTFIGWDKNFEQVASDLEVMAIFEKNISNTIINYTSYLASFSYNQVNSYTELLEDFDYVNNLEGTIININYGGYRLTDQVHYYDSTNIRTRNTFGFEVAIDENNVVIKMATLVDLPNNGAILSGHGDGAQILEDSLKIGDIVIYDSGEADYYRQTGISEVLDLNVKINNAVDLINSSYNNLKALNYQLLLDKTNQLIDIYNNLLLDYNLSNYNIALALYMDISYLSIEETAVMVKGYWHYPLRNTGYLENNTASIALLLDEVARMGFNRVYLNTNFGGYTIYKSTILPQRLTNYYAYVGYKDYLECFIALAHARGIEVYAWTNTLIGGDGEANSYYSTRNWLNESYSGSKSFSGMYFIDIANVDARAHLLDVFTELAGYNLDGIEYDFIRYPNSNILDYSGIISDDSGLLDSGYTDNFILPFMSQNDLTGDFKTILRNDETARESWYTYKRTILTDFVSNLSTTIKATNSNIKISAAVMPSITTARSVYNQDWKTWIALDYVDILDPMIYTGSIDYLISALNAMKIEVGSDASIVAGIFPEGSGLDVSENAYQISKIIETYVLGFSKFSSRQIFSSENVKNSLSLISKHYTTASSESLDIRKAYVFDLYDKVNNFYKYYDSQTDYSLFLSTLLNAIQIEEYQGINLYITTFLDSILDVDVKDKLQAYDVYINELIGAENE